MANPGDPALKAAEELMRLLLTALESAPHKHRIDFQAYWDWYDGPRAAAAERAQQLLRELAAASRSIKPNSTG